MSTNWTAMGLGHLQPFQPCFVVAPPTDRTRSDYKKHPVLITAAYKTAIALCETQAERGSVRKKFIRDWNRENILRVNKTTHLGAHGGLSKGQKAPR